MVRLPDTFRVFDYFFRSFAPWIPLWILFFFCFNCSNILLTLVNIFLVLLIHEGDVQDGVNQLL